MNRGALRLLAVLALLLFGAVALDRRGPRSVSVSQRVLPALAADDLRRVELQSVGGAPVVLERDAAGGWRVDGHPADPDAMRDFLANLEYLSWRRRVPPAEAAARGLDPPRFRVVFVDSDGRRELAIGRSEPALGRTWARASLPFHFLVDDQAARALDRDAGELRRRRVFLPGPGEPERVRIEDAGGAALELSGLPACVAAPVGGCALADRRRTGELIDRLEELSLTRFLAAPPPGTTARVITYGVEKLEIGGVCPDAAGERAVVTAAGAGCLAERDVAQLLAEPLDAPAWVERRVTSLEPAAVDRIRAGEVVLERRGSTWRHGDVELSSEAVREWLDVLASHRGTPSWTRTPPSGPATLELAAGPRREVLRLAADRPVIRRGDEPVELTVHPAARAAFTLDLARLADRRVIELDATALAEIRVEEPGTSAEVVSRGATLDDWRVSAPVNVPADEATVAALRKALSPLHAAAATAGRPTPDQGLDPPRRRLTLVEAPRPDAPEGSRRVLELGATVADGCHARVAGREVVYLLRTPTCAALSAHFATRDAYTLEPDELRAVTIDGRRLERHGTAWYDASGNPVPDEESRAATSVVRLLARAPAVAGYGPPPAGRMVVIEGPEAPITLIVNRDTYARADRPVLYRTPPAACTPTLCR